MNKNLQYDGDAFWFRPECVALSEEIIALLAEKKLTFIEAEVVLRRVQHDIKDYAIIQSDYSSSGPWSDSR